MNDVFDTDILKLLGTLYENDIFIWQEQGKLKYKSKEGKISKDILMQLKDMKLAIISFLQAVSYTHLTLPTTPYV